MLWYPFITDLNDVANLIAVTALIPLGLFIYYYGTEPIEGRRFLRKPSNRWKSTLIGKVLMAQKILWFAFLLFVLTSIFMPGYPGQDLVRVLAYGGLVVQFWVVFFTLRHIQKLPPPVTYHEGAGIQAEENIPLPGAAVEEAIPRDEIEKDNEDE